MSIQVDFDLKDILNEIKQDLKNIDNRLNNLEQGQTDIRGEIKRIDSNIDTLKEDIREIKGSQRAQIWTLIGVLITAIGGFIVAIGRSVLSFNP